MANETVVSKALVDLIEEKAKSGEVRVTVLAPVNQPRQGYVVYYDTRRAAARRRLDKTLELLRSDHIPATGVVVETDPVSALRDAIGVNPAQLVLSLAHGDISAPLPPVTARQLMIAEHV